MTYELEIYKENTCPICGVNGSVRKWLVHFHYNRKAKVCVSCFKELGGSAYIVRWLELNAIYENKKLVGFRHPAEKIIPNAENVVGGSKSSPQPSPREGEKYE